MLQVNIDKEVFKCAANSLNLHEIQGILEEHNISSDRRDKKHELIDKMLSFIDNNTLSEELYTFN